MNNQNLVPLGNNPERDREIRRKGALAAAEKKRRRRTLKEEWLELLSIVNEEGISNQRLVLDAILLEALKGNVKAYTAIEASIGEKPVERVENTISSENKQAVDDFLKEVKNGKSKNT